MQNHLQSHRCVSPDYDASSTSCYSKLDILSVEWQATICRLASATGAHTLSLSLRSMSLFGKNFNAQVSRRLLNDVTEVQRWQLWSWSGLPAQLQISQYGIVSVVHCVRIAMDQSFRRWLRHRYDTLPITLSNQTVSVVLAGDFAVQILMDWQRRRCLLQLEC